MVKTLHKIPHAKIVAAIRKSKGCIADAAKLAGCSPAWLRRLVNKHAVIKEVLDEEREQLIDLSEMTIREKVESGDVDTAKFVLRTLGRNRGWGENLRFDASVNATGKVHIYLPDNGRDNAHLTRKEE
jgi:hypothetical protein